MSAAEQKKIARALYNSNRRESENERKVNARLLATPEVRQAAQNKRLLATPEVRQAAHNKRLLSTTPEKKQVAKAKRLLVGKPSVTPEKKQAAKDKRLLLETPERKQAAKDKRAQTRRDVENDKAYMTLHRSLMPPTLQTYEESSKTRVTKIIIKAYICYLLRHVQRPLSDPPNSVRLSQGEIRVSLLKIILDDTSTTVGIIFEGVSSRTYNFDYNIGSRLKSTKPENLDHIYIKENPHPLDNELELGSIVYESIVELCKNYKHFNMCLDRYQTYAEMTIDDKFYDDWENLLILFVKTIGELTVVDPHIKKFTPVIGPPITLPDNVLAGLMHQSRRYFSERAHMHQLRCNRALELLPMTEAQIAARPAQNYSMDNL